MATPLHLLIFPCSVDQREVAALVLSYAVVGSVHLGVHVALVAATWVLISIVSYHGFYNEFIMMISLKYDIY